MEFYRIEPKKWEVRASGCFVGKIEREPRQSTFLTANQSLFFVHTNRPENGLTLDEMKEIVTFMESIV